MTDIFLSANLAVDVADVTRQLRFSVDTQTWSGQTAGLTWIVTRVDRADLWAPAWDSASRTRCLVAGRFAFDEEEWLEAERLPYEGGLAAKLALRRWLKGGARAVEDLNGAGLAVIVNEATHEVLIWTDRMGFYPAFAWREGGFIVCSHPDVTADVLAKAGRPCPFDAVTMAEFLRTGTATQPHTYWRGIDQLDAATRYRFTWGGESRLRETSQYWRPAYFDRPYLEDRGEIVDRLADALRSAVRKRTLPRLGKVALLLSSGADSRVALFGACEPSNVTCFTFYDEPNQELRGAQALAVAAGATHIGYQRSKDYYFEHAERTVRVSGGMWSVDSGHYGGVLERLGEENPGVVLTGCYADYLLKGLAYNRRHRTLMGRPIPLYEYADFSHEWYQPFGSIAQPWLDQVERRQDARFSTVAKAGGKARSMAEYLRVSPIIREADASGRLFLRRCAPLDLFMADKDVLELAGWISPDQKLSGIPFGMAVSRITGKVSRHVMNNNYSAPVGASEFQRLGAFVRASLMRKVRREGGGQPFEHDPASVATVGSWPHLPRVITLSQRVLDWRSSQTPEQREFLFDLLGAERRDWSIRDWADHAPTLFMRYYTASLWLGQQPGALRTASSQPAQ